MNATNLYRLVTKITGDTFFEGTLPEAIYESNKLYAITGEVPELELLEERTMEEYHWEAEKLEREKMQTYYSGLGLGV